MSTGLRYGFATSSGVDWTKYVKYRPIYPPSFFQMLFEYHAQKPEVGWSFSHDVGAGAGIVSGSLSHRFEHVIVSDPNDGYMPLAQKVLIEESGLPASKFTFLQETGERSTLKSNSVDLIAACESIQWMDADAALAEFHRVLKPGGSVLVSYYTRPRIPDNRRAEAAWDRIFPILANRERNKVHDRAFNIADSGLTSLAFPETRWKSVKRVFVNAQGSIRAFKLTDLDLAESKVSGGEEVSWLENDSDWSDLKGIEWFKGYVATWVPAIPEAEIREIWDEIEVALDGAKTRIETPVAIILATTKHP